MRKDLPQPDERDTRPRRIALALALVALALAVVALVAPPIDAQEQERAIEHPLEHACAIRGRAAIPALHVSPTSRRARRASRAPRTLSLPEQEIAVHLESPGFFSVEARSGDTPTRGWTSSAISFVTRAARTASGVTLRAEAPIVRIARRGEALEIDAALDADTALRQLVVQCDEVLVGEPSPASEPEPIASSNPTRRARARDLSVRAEPTEGVPLARLRSSRPLLLEERSRVEAFVRVRARFARGELDGWVREQDVLAGP